MLAYLATKDQFLLDAPTIEDIVKNEVKRKLGHNVGDAEYSSWRNSLGNAMYHAMNTPEIHGDAGVAIEYRVNGRAFRIDFMLSGKNAAGEESLVIIELKQWTDIEFSDLAEHVRAYVGGGVRDAPHPSYQAWSYLSHLKMYNEYIYDTKVSVNACAYLHNCDDETVVSASRYEEKLREVPVFIKGQIEQLRSMISANIEEGSGTGLLERIDAAVIRPSQQLADAVGSMLKGHEEFVLLDEQKTVLEKIVKAANDSLTGQKRALVINGGPGTGKSVISINALVRLTGQRLNARYVTPNAAPRAVFEAKLKKIFGKADIRSLFSGSGSFTESASESFDTLIVDEAHRLKMKSGMFRNLGENQVKEIIESAHTSVFFIDEAQKVTWADVGEILMIEEQAGLAGARIERLELTSQFRCGGSDDYMAWLDEVLGLHADTAHYFSRDKFDFQIFDSPTDLHKTIKEKNRLNNKSRVVAGYCWDWISKNNPNLSDITIDDFGYKATWNLTSDGSEWIISPKSVNEVGCIHTCQGLEVDYIGVIIGRDLICIDGVLVTDPSARAKTDKSLAGYKKEFKIDQISADIKADEIIRNTYRTLMSRGMKGCYVYFVDPATAEYFKKMMPS
ncbi:MAG: DUF2075 domain-containing protein [Streptomycetaceae bacterium]|nr:MAG: DUF2075 domain-containing protein [Streptomycetaceae bacterium]